MNVMDEFPDLNALTLPELHAKYQSLKGDGPSRELSDDDLKQLLAIARVLRRRASAPTSKTSTKKIAPSLDAL